MGRGGSRWDGEEGRNQGCGDFRQLLCLNHTIPPCLSDDH
jgi:hypothetical protein